MYQLLSGHLPFWDEQSDRSPFAVMSAILSAEVRLRPHRMNATHPGSILGWSRGRIRQT